MAQAGDFHPRGHGAALALEVSDRHRVALAALKLARSTRSRPGGIGPLQCSGFAVAGRHDTVGCAMNHQQRRQNASLG